MLKERQLMDGCGTFLCTLSKQESEEMVRAGKIVRISRHKYRLNAAVAPSTARESECMLTRSDMEAFAFRHFSDGKLTQRLEERFIGHLLLRVRETVAPKRHSETRAVYFEAPIESGELQAASV